MSDPALTGRRWQVLATIFSLAVVVRILLFAAMGRVDGESVIRVFPAAEAIARGEWGEAFAPGVPPLYPLIVALGRLISGDVEIGARVISLVGGVLAGLPLLILVRRVHGMGAATAGVFLLAIHPLFSRYSVMARGEVLAAILLTASAYAGWRLLEGRGVGWGLLSGLVSGLGFLIRPECLALPVVALLWLLASGGSWRERAVAAAALLGPLIVILGVHSMWIHHRTGAWTLTPKLAINLEYGEERGERWAPVALTGDGEEVEFFRRVERGQFSVLGVVGRAVEEPAAAIGRTLRHGGRLLTYIPHLIGYPNLLLLPFVLAALRDGGRRRQILFVLSVIAFSLATFSLFYPARRMVVLLIPLALVLPAIGLSAVTDRLIGRGEEPVWGRGWAFFLWAGLFVLTIPFHARTAHDYGGWMSPHRVAGLYVQTKVLEDQTFRMLEGVEGAARGVRPARIMSHPTDLAHFAGAEAVLFPRSGYEETIRYARLHGVEYIAYDLGAVERGRPAFAAISKENEDLEWLGTLGDGPLQLDVYRLR